MNSALLFVLCTLIWGSTWIAITFQIGETSEVLAVAWRYTIASVCLGVFCLVKRNTLSYPRHMHIKMAAVGLFLFCLNYTLLYMAQEHIVSALLALLSSSIIYFNVVLRWWWLKQPIKREVVVGATFGLVGICCLFAPEFSSVSMSTGLIIGLVVAMLSFVSAAVGGVVSERALNLGVPVMPMNFYAMTYATVFLYIAALISGESMIIPTSASFYWSLLYLALFGSVLAFGAYMKLVKQIGADKAAYVVLMYPIVALIISTFFEGYSWSWLSVLGVAVVLWGNAIAMGKITMFVRKPTE